MLEFIKKIAGELSLNESHVANTTKLLFDEECTIPFIARYRKEMTGEMDEVNIREVRDRFTYLQDLDATKKRYIKVLEEQAKEKPELQKQLATLSAKFMACENKRDLEDLYLPFKPKRRTRAQAAKEKGLEPLLTTILEEKATITDLNAIAEKYVTPEGTEKTKAVPSVLHALAGAKDILAERINETADYRSIVREISNRTGKLSSAYIELSENADPKEKKSHLEKASKYQNYYEFSEPITAAVSHRVMAIFRGEKEKILRVSIDVDADAILAELTDRIIGKEAITDVVKDWILKCIEDSYRRLMSPSMETEIRMQLKKNAEEEAIKVFSTNLENLLLLPPIPGTVVLGVDPGIRTGSKLAVVSETGKILEYATVYPTPGQNNSPKTKEAKQIIFALMAKHNVKCVAVGNGTGSREIDQIIIETMKENGIKGIKRSVVNESGASVYSTDDIAREEFPDLDPTIRSTISIARRLQDPLAELVKIEPRSIGVGQYQHDCNATKLNSSLKETVESCVNRVGININTASFKLLTYVSGIGQSLAKSIVSFRDQNGKFASRNEILKVPGFGAKAFQQSAGFLRVPNSENPLDNSSVHPERYDILKNIAKDLDLSLSAIIGKSSVINNIHWEKYTSDEVGMPTLKDIAAELLKPGRDPREDGARLMFSDEVSTIEDLKKDMKLPGTVTNVTNFGAFVDIGVHQDGLVHISELSDTFIKDPAEAVSVGDVLTVRVMEVDIPRKRISLSCKTGTTSERKGGEAYSSASNKMNSYSTKPRQNKKKNTPPQKESFSASDLLAKFNR